MTELVHQNLGSQWQFYDRRELHPLLRRHKLIGRRAIDEVRLAREVRGLLPITSSNLLRRVAGVLSWLCDGDGTEVPTVWNAWQTQNGCIYLAPPRNQLWRLHRADRRFDETLTSDGAGLCATEFAISC